MKKIIAMTCAIMIIGILIILNMPKPEPDVEETTINELYPNAVNVTDEENKQECFDIYHAMALYQDIIQNTSSLQLSNDELNQIYALLDEQYVVMYMDQPNASLQDAPEFYHYYDELQANIDTPFTFYQVASNGTLSKNTFIHKEGEDYLLTTTAKWNNEKEPEVYDMEKFSIDQISYEDSGYFIYHPMQHYKSSSSAVSSLRIKPYDITSQELYQKYIAPILYYSNNLFLVDWDQNNMSAIEFNDLFDHLYALKYNETFVPTKISDQANGYILDPSLYEETIQSYLNISSSTLREYSRFDSTTQKYDYHLPDAYYMTYRSLLLPEVTNYEYLPDGTLKLTIEVYAQDHRNQDHFIHTLIIQENDDGSFKYLSNHLETPIPDYLTYTKRLDSINIQ